MTTTRAICERLPNGVEVFDVPASGEVTVGKAATTGRDIRLNAAGKFLAQPCGDNYWLEFDSYTAAVDAADGEIE